MPFLHNVSRNSGQNPTDISGEPMSLWRFGGEYSKTDYTAGDKIEDQWPPITFLFLNTLEHVTLCGMETCNVRFKRIRYFHDSDAR